MKHLNDQHVLILGLGISGLAMARWCARCGAHVTVADTRSEPPGLEALRAGLPQAEFISGALTAGLVASGRVQQVYVSPGLAPAGVAPVRVAAQAAGLVFDGELGLFSRALADLRDGRGYTPQVLAVTGTNGKTTVTSLTGQLVQRAGKSVAVAGNIGPSMLDVLGGHLDADTLPQVWVLELSSFQLDGVRDFEPAAATVLNLTQDHLDWHGDMAAYAAAKARVFGERALMVLNRDDAQVMRMLPPPVVGKRKRMHQRPYVTFGTDLPQRPGDYGLEVAAGMGWLVRVMEEDGPAGKGVQQELHIQRLMPADALRIRGRHNAANALAALALAQAAGCTLASLLYGLREYRGEPHRVQSVGIVSGVEYFDDSKGTNVGATLAAIQGLGADGRRLVMILGGQGKGQDFSPLAPAIARHARAVVLIGQDAALIRDALGDCGAPLLHAAGMEEAVAQAAAYAQPGDAVVMSPACASLDMFRDYAHRAQVFVEAVRGIAADAGVALEAAA